MTALKFAELAAKAGFPKGVINILPGSGVLLQQETSLSIVMVVLLDIEMTKIQWWITLNCSVKLQAAYSVVVWTVVIV